MKKNNTLPLITKKEQILENTATLDRYLKKGNSQESEYAKGLIQRGKCFVVVSSHDEYSFYPSRFIGYVDNTMGKHEEMGEAKRATGKITRDGRDTTPAISEILGDLIEVGNKQWGTFETAYNKFCEKLGITPYKKERKFWRPISK
jgi:hypothetical protein